MGNFQYPEGMAVFIIPALEERNNRIGAQKQFATQIDDIARVVFQAHLKLEKIEESLKEKKL